MNPPVESRGMPGILYVMGTARSGSTILEILLSKGAGCFGAGEITSLIQDGFVENKDCSCGNRCKNCPVWGKVLGAIGNVDFHEWAAIQKKMDWHDGFLRQLSGMTSGQDEPLYRLRNQDLLRHVGEVTGASVVVDSSKYAGRALALKRMGDVDLKVICLTRSPEGLMTSFRKANRDEQRPKSPLAALLYYVITLFSLRTAVMLLGKENVFMLRYEDMVSDPRGTLADIVEWSGIDFSESMRMLEAGQAFEVGHVVTGNRLRKQEKVQFRGSDERRTLGTLQEKMAVAMMNGWKWILRF